MKYIIAFIFLILFAIGYSQEFTIEGVQFNNPRSTDSSIEFPKLKSPVNKNNEMVEKINHELLSGLMIESYNPEELEEFNWMELEYSSEIKDDLLYITFNGFYMTSYAMYVEETYYFDLKTGDQLKIKNIPFHALFTLSGYLDFIDEYWLDSVKIKFEEAILCADEEPSCSYYDISSYTKEKENLSIWLSDDCYESYNNACTPYHNISVELDSIKHHLNDLGKYMFLESDYFSKSNIEKFLENKSLSEQFQNNIFMFAEIDGKYPVTIAMNIDDEGQVSGYYYYNKNHENIELKGQRENDMLTITETHNNKMTGIFEFKIDSEYGFIESGKWSNPARTKTYDIEIIEVKNNR